MVLALSLSLSLSLFLFRSHISKHCQNLLEALVSPVSNDSGVGGR